MNTVYILGRQSDLAIAEIESLLGEKNINKIDDLAVISNHDPGYIPFSRLGGSVKVGKVLTTVPYTEWNKIENYILKTAPEVLNFLAPEGKINLGVSVYGFKIGVNQINASGLRLKKVVKQTGRSVRIVPNKTPELNAAQIIHNKLTGSQGWELLIIRDGQQTILAQTVDVQDIEAYAARDQVRPKRDARVGMLPPKLAQIIINIASTGNNRYGAAVLDPFCGTGVILQEASLMGFDSYGTDLDPRMIEYTEINLDWLSEEIYRKPISWRTEVADAMNFKWTGEIDFIAAETYLGRPLSQDPDQQTLDKIIGDCDHIHKKFLLNLAPQIKSGTRICIAVPAWITRNGIFHLKVLDSLEKLGYTRQSFVHANNNKLIYYREGQKVGRELVVLVRK